MMKTLRVILSAVVLCVLSSCDKHDKLDELVYVGKMAPHVYWSIASTTVSAGQDVSFDAQYYTTSDVAISHLEVWYNVVETEKKNVSAPWVTSKAYTVASNLTTERRKSQLITRYDHNESYWNEKERAYKFAAVFPTSNVLSKVAWSDAEFDSTNVVKYFGDDFMQHFKDSLYHTLIANPDDAWKDFNKLFTSADTSDIRYKYRVKYFTPYTTKSHDDVSDTDYSHFVDHVIPAPLDSLFLTFDFADIISSLHTDKYSISYEKSYQLDAQLKCLDTEKTAGLALKQTITLN